MQRQTSAGHRALEGGATTKGVLELIRRFRATSEIPIVIFTYLNPIYSYGFTRFHEDAAEAAIHTTEDVRQVFWKSGPPTEACGRVPPSTGCRRRLKPCIRPSEPLLDCRRDWFLVGGSESSDGRNLPALSEAVTFSRLRKIPGWMGQPEDIRWRPWPPPLS